MCPEERIQNYGNACSCPINITDYQAFGCLIYFPSAAGAFESCAVPQACFAALNFTAPPFGNF